MQTLATTPLQLTDRALRTFASLFAVAGALIFALLAAEFIARDATFAALGAKAAIGNGWLLFGMRLIMVGGIVATALVYVALDRLLGIVRTVQRRDPFVPENAARLRTVAWAMLGLEVVHAMIAAIAGRVSTVLTTLDIHWSFHFTQWLTLLLLFALAEAFEHGARMRDDLEGTV